MKAVKAPADSQLLYYPMEECTVAAGFKNAKYRKKHGYTHWGVDFDDRWGKDFDVLSPGNGTILGTEMNKNNSIGGVIVMRCNKVYDPTHKFVRPGGIIRLYHNGVILVQKGQKVKAGDVIGKILGNHPYFNHIHMEIDWDVKYPFHTIQVKEKASKLLIQKNACADTLANPINILVVGKHQTAMVHSKATLADKVKDAPRYYEA